MTSGFDPLDMLKMRADTFRRVLSQAPQRAKNDHVTIAMSEEFNRLLEDMATSFPAAAAFMPRKITAQTDVRIAGCADVKLIELQILAEQVLGVLERIAET